MNLMNDMNEKPSFEQFQKQMGKNKIGKVLLLVKILSFIWETSKTILLILLVIKNFF